MPPGGECVCVPESSTCTRPAVHDHVMRHAFAHDAILTMDADGDVRAPGAAITVALCGHWEHEPPCPLAPHHTAATREGDEVRLRVLFVAESTDEDEIRTRINRALAGGRIDDAQGRRTHWRLRGTSRGSLRDDETEHAQRLGSN